MKSYPHLTALAFIIMAFGGCKEKLTSDTADLAVDAFERSINTTSEKVILDVRTPEEFNEGHIRNAMLINFHDEDFLEQLSKLDKEIPVYLYCASGVRSAKAATKMKEQGFDQVFVLAGGLNEWKERNKELTR